MCNDVVIALGLIVDKEKNIILFPFADQQNALPFTKWFDAGLIDQPIERSIAWPLFRILLTQALSQADIIKINLEAVTDRLDVELDNLQSVLVDTPTGNEAWLRAELNIIAAEYCDITTFYLNDKVIDTDLC